MPYPTSCSPQAWASAAPLLLLRVMLGLDPDVPSGVVRLAPALPPSTATLKTRGLGLWDRRFDVLYHSGVVEVTGLPTHVQARTGEATA